MPSLAAVTTALESIAPLRLAADWDAVGLLVSPRRPALERVMTCLSLTEDVANEAVRRAADLVVTHHPLPFRPVARLTDESSVGRVLLALAGAGTGVWSPHTAWDSAAGGINDQLAAMLGLAHVAPLEPDAELPLVGFGRAGTAPEGMTVAALARRAAAGLAVVAVGHHASERFSMAVLAERLSAAVPGLECWASEVERDPLGWLESG